ncbi:hypothetical protein GFM07_32370 [Rhizobium leguminosarum bv. viciae]|nr:hypothetical protein [Rhizobium leguminosarum bv. viciae]
MAGLIGILAVSAGTGSATNYPCSGSKGGVNHCQGSTFVCNDGSVSGSKKNCQAVMGGASLLGTGAPEMSPSLTGSCDCDTGLYCVGPRGGRYCTTNSGKKSYLKN